MAIASALSPAATPVATQQPERPAGPDRPTFSARADLVALRISVVDPRTGPVAALQRDAFSIYENGAPQEIVFFTNDDIPATVGLVVDSSGSMGPKRDLVRAAAMAFARSRNPDDELFVVAFNEKFYFGLPPSVPFTSDLAVLRQALTVTGARGMTGLYDAVGAALDHVRRGRRDTRALVVLSDGADNSSGLGLDALVARIEAADVVVHTVGLFARSDRDANPNVLRKLARASGGLVSLLDEARDVSPTLERIARDIRHSYTLGYVPTDPRTDGYRRLQVLVRAPNRSRLSVRYREGYRVAPSGADERSRP